MIVYGGVKNYSGIGRLILMLSKVSHSTKQQTEFESSNNFNLPYEDNFHIDEGINFFKHEQIDETYNIPKVKELIPV